MLRRILLAGFAVLLIAPAVWADECAVAGIKFTPDLKAFSKSFPVGKWSASYGAPASKAGFERLCGGDSCDLYAASQSTFQRLTVAKDARGVRSLRLTTESSPSQLDSMTKALGPVTRTQGFPNGRRILEWRRTDCRIVYAAAQSWQLVLIERLPMDPSQKTFDHRDVSEFDEFNPTGVAVKTTVENGRWNYVITNQGALPISGFSLAIEAPITHVTGPREWTLDTDGCSIVRWYSHGESSDLMPGKSLGGFSFETSSKEKTNGALYVAQAISGTAEIRGAAPTPGSPGKSCGQPADWGN